MAELHEKECSVCGKIDFLPTQGKCQDCYAKVKEESRGTLEAVKSIPEGSIRHESVKSIFNRIERRHDNLFDGTSGNEKEHVKVSSTEAAATGDSASNVDSVHLRRLDELRERTKSMREYSLANKTKNLLLKGKAIGDSTIPSEDRRYLIITFLESADTRKCMFVNKQTCSVGDLVEKVCKAFTFPAFKKAMRPEGMSLDIYYLEPDSHAVVADLDRREMVASTIPEMAEVIFIAKSSAEMADLSSKIAAAVDRQRAEEEAARLEAERIKAEAEEATRQEQLAKARVDPASVSKGDMMLYVKDANKPQLVSIVTIHLDDFPNLYFTIKFESTGNEKQTTADFLRLIKADAVSAAEGGFPISVHHGTRVLPVMGVSEGMSVAALKVMVQSASGIAPKKQKLICKGVVLKDAQIVSETKITRGCKVSLMASKK